MNKARFDKAFARFLEDGDEKVTPKTFFEAMAAADRQHVAQTVELTASVVDGQLRFAPSAEVSVHDNVIVLENREIIIKVA